MTRQCNECGGCGFHVEYSGDIPEQVLCETCRVYGLNETLMDRVAILEQLVKHCWIHSGYQDCGRNQMGSALGQVYDDIVRRSSDELG